MSRSGCTSGPGAPPTPAARTSGGLTRGGTAQGAALRIHAAKLNLGPGEMAPDIRRASHHDVRHLHRLPLIRAIPAGLQQHVVPNLLGTDEARTALVDFERVLASPDHA